MRILMCSPQYFGIYYEINPWMSLQRQACVETAQQQWQHLRQILEQLGVEISLVNPIAGIPDLTFTANAGLVHNNTVYASHFLHPERQLEEPYYRAWFQDAGYQVLPPVDNFHFEGAGDALFAGDILFVGYGIRSQQVIYPKLQAQFPHWLPGPVVECELIDPYFYHLDTCFCPLNTQQAIWFPSAFSRTSQQRLQQSLELWPVPDEEAHRFACNAVVVAKQVVLPTGCEQTQAYLESQGYTTHTCAMDEFLKAGGACKCLTLTL